MRKFISTKEKRVLAIDPSTRGFGFAVLEGPADLLDWGVKEVRKDKHEGCLRKIKELLQQYQPDALVLEDYEGAGSRRCLRVQRLIRAIWAVARKNRVPCYGFSRQQVRSAFAGMNASTKHEIAMAVVTLFPELAPRLPPFRKPWMSEDYRMSIFDAVSFALTFFYSRKARQTNIAKVRVDRAESSRLTQKLVRTSVPFNQSYRLTTGQARPNDAVRDYRSDGFGGWKYEFKWIDPKVVPIDEGELEWKKISQQDLRRSLEALKRMKPYLIDVDLSTYAKRLELRERLRLAVDRNGEPVFDEDDLNFFDLYFLTDVIEVSKIGDSYEVASGRHRLWMAQREGMDTIPALVAEKSTTAESK